MGLVGGPSDKNTLNRKHKQSEAKHDKFSDNPLSRTFKATTKVRKNTEPDSLLPCEISVDHKKNGIKKKRDGSNGLLHDDKHKLKNPDKYQNNFKMPKEHKSIINKGRVTSECKPLQRK